MTRNLHAPRPPGTPPRPYTYITREKKEIRVRSVLSEAEREQLLVDYVHAIEHNAVDMRDDLITRFEKVSNGAIFIAELRKVLK